MIDGSIQSDVVARIWARDDSLWAEGDDRPSERLGWLTLPTDMRVHLDELRELARRVAETYRTVALLGMGGSSLAPELFASMFRLANHPELVVVDTTHPDQIGRITEALDLEHTLFCVASKSGTTAETLALYHFFRDLVSDGEHFVAISDPGTPLVSLAEETGFGAIFENPPDIGGRYSALSLFGLVPAALVGTDVEGLLDSAEGQARRSTEPDSPAVDTGSRLARTVHEGRDKLTLRPSPELGMFGDWVEQLLAESTGKHGTGVVPIVDEPALENYGADRLIVSLGADVDKAPFHRPVGGEGLGSEVYHWEFATAVAGVGLGINPFDQPDVEAAKRAARTALESTGSSTWPDESPDDLFDGIEPPEYAAILAFAPATDENRAILQRARSRVGNSTGVATVGAFGPRYLHSSGQLYKGGPKRLRALVILSDPSQDLSIPGQAHTFGRLITAQAVGDSDALEAAGQRVARVGWNAFIDWLGGDS